MAHALVFALIAGVSMAAYSVFLRMASPGIHPAMGAAIITGVAFVANLSLVMVMKASGAQMGVSSRSVWFAMVVGLAAAAADFFTLSAYGSGLKVTSSFVIGGTSTVLVLLVGFLVLREPFTVMKLVAAGLIAAGIFLLQREGF